MFCKNCGAEADDNAAFCPKCGAVLKSENADTAAEEKESQSEVKKFCRKCGQGIPEGAAFCPKCGASVNAEQEPQPANNMSANKAPANNAPANNANTGITNVYALVGFICSFIISLLGLIFSIIGYKEAEKTGNGKGFAIAGIVISSVFLFITIVIVSVYACAFCVVLGSGVTIY